MLGISLRRAVFSTGIPAAAGAAASAAVVTSNKTSCRYLHTTSLASPLRPRDRKQRPDRRSTSGALGAGVLASTVALFSSQTETAQCAPSSSSDGQAQAPAEPQERKQPEQQLKEPLEPKDSALAVPAASAAAGSGIRRRLKWDERKPVTPLNLPLGKLKKASTGKPLVVLVACGSYSPITNLHLRIFEDARNHLMRDEAQFDVVGGFISCVHDEYGKASLIGYQHRVNMCRAAVESSNWLEVAAWETEQETWCPTALVLDAYENAINASGLYDRPVTCKLICGADVLESVLIPGLWYPEHLKLIFGKHGVACIERQGLHLAKLVEDNAELKQFQDTIHVVPQRISNAISSTVSTLAPERGTNSHKPHARLERICCTHRLGRGPTPTSLDESAHTVSLTPCRPHSLGHATKLRGGQERQVPHARPCHRVHIRP